MLHLVTYYYLKRQFFWHLVIYKVSN